MGRALADPERAAHKEIQLFFDIWLRVLGSVFIQQSSCRKRRKIRYMKGAHDLHLLVLHFTNHTPGLLK